MSDLARIIRCIRIRRDLWEALRKAAKEDDAYISHMIEAMIRTYLVERGMALLVAEGSEDKDAAVS